MLSRPFRIACIILTIVTLHACTTTDQPGTLDAPEVDATEDNYFLLENYQAAVSYYQEKIITEADPEQRIRHQLRLAAAYAHIDQVHKAREILGTLDIENNLATTSIESKQLYLLAKSHIAIVERHAENVLNLLSTRFDPNTDPVYQAEYHELRARAFSLLNKRIESSQARIEREPYLDIPELITKNQHAIWDTLAHLSIRTLQHYITKDSQDTLSGWMALIKIAKAFQLNPTELKIEISKWRQTYASHPVQDEIIDNLLQRQPEDVIVPKNIAIMVPLSNKFKTAGEAVRDGFIAAYFSQKGERDQNIKVYDSAVPENQFWGLYQRVIAEGAQLVIGPIEKQQIDILAQQDTLPVPTIALNYIPTTESLPGNLYQFGLSPEEEAIQVSERTWLDGHIRAAILTPSGPWGDRVHNAFKERWEALGGRVVAHETYNSSLRDFSLPIRKLLSINESRNRYRSIATTIKQRLKYTARRRQDIDFIFLAAYPRQARQIRPQLKFYHAAHVPVYATSHVYTGNLNQERDRDMDGIKFGDMPWVLAESTTRRGLRSEIESQISSAGNALQRLFALGLDAFNIIGALNTLRNYPYERFDGETGSLSLDNRLRLRRRLTWVKFRSGRPVAVDQGNL